MDFVYICRDGDNPELRYSLRTIYKNTNVNSVWVVGGKPDWYKGNHIPVPQTGGKYENAQNNLRAIMRSSRIKDKFILMNDDFYIINPIDSIPVYHGGSLEEKAQNFKNFKFSSKHAQMLEQTVDLLKRNGVPHPLDYSLHVPMTIHKSLFEFSLSMGGAIRSVYGNMNRIGGTLLPVDDVKVHQKHIHFPESYDFKKHMDHIPFLSSWDKTFPLCYRAVLKEYSEASPWERVTP